MIRQNSPNCLTNLNHLSMKGMVDLIQLQNEEDINESTYSFLFTSGSRPGILYGLPKIHKTNKFTDNKYPIQNTITFVQNLIEIPHAIDFVLASFDVTYPFK